MEIIYTTHAREDYEYCKKHDTKMLHRIHKLLEAIQNDPFKGKGKPEPLRFNRSGYWSRRIDRNHRLIYKIVNQTLYIAQCRYHYDK